MAKEKVMAVLDTKSSRVTLKMDVSHTDHSHIIGKGGYNIKKVMQDTGCHIHFPDSNRGSSSEKSNQVSIAGQPLGVESARLHIREMLPLILTFELPLTGRSPMDNNTNVIQRIGQTYNVAISFKQRPRCASQTAIVRGSQQHVPAIKEAIKRLVEHFTGSIASAVPVSMQIDIAPQHHLFIIGKNGANIKHITQQTGASVNFPDPNGTQRKGVVFLSGSVESVICARAQLLDCLPLVLMFDLREEDGDIDAMQLNKVMERYDVFVSVKPKPKQPSKSVIIKSAERNARNIYLARMELLGLDNNENRAVSPTYSSSSSLSPGDLDRPCYPGVLDLSPTLPYGNVMNGKTSPSPPPNSWFPTTAPSPQHNTSTSLIRTSAPQYNYLSPSPPPLPPPGLGPPNTIGVVPTTYGDFTTSPGYCSIDSAGSILSGTTSPVKTTVSPIGTRSQSPFHNVRSPVMDHRPSSSGSSSPRSPTVGSPPTIQDDAYTTSRMRSDSELEKLLSHAGNSSTNGNMLTSERQTVEILSGAKNVSLHTSDSGESESLSSSLRSSLFNKLLLNHPHSIPPIDEYERKKELASKAMQKKVHFPEVRVPTNSWSGLGFSKSMPESAIKELLESKGRNQGGNMLPYTPVNGTLHEHPFSPSSLMPDQPTTRESRSYSTSSYEVHPPNDRKEATFSPTVGEWSRGSYSGASSHPPTTDLQSLFDRLGLAKYFGKFQEQEIDLQTFMTLTEDDLKEIGVSTFGPRRKLLMAISDLNNKQQDAKQSTSPRSTSPSQSYSDDNSSQDHAFPKRLQLNIASHSGRW
ncbi:protein bicaudal C homolog 1-B isoform X2 [Nematostella vectensis]|nr:protein bicaudal C homolog 1-B isoform X2 [Nematostella vectensis]XP_048581582.1 protein bicaudal C homolog 1-B isoform X2 [Nematostella vectensis]